MKKQPEKTAKTKQIFVDVFCKLYTQKPFEKILVQEITNKAGYNRSTFYEYFSDMYDLLTYIENDVLDYIIEKLQEEKAGQHLHAQNLLLLFKEKEKYLNALFGHYGFLRFSEQLKKRAFFDNPTYEFLKGHPMAPYLFEYQITTAISLFHLWTGSFNDSSSGEIFNFIYHLHAERMEAFLGKLEEIKKQGFLDKTYGNSGPVLH